MVCTCVLLLTNVCTSGAGPLHLPVMQAFLKRAVPNFWKRHIHLLSTSGRSHLSGPQPAPISLASWPPPMLAGPPGPQQLAVARAAAGPAAAAQHLSVPHATSPLWHAPLPSWLAAATASAAAPPASISLAVSPAGPAPQHLLQQLLAATSAQQAQQAQQHSQQQAQNALVQMLLQTLSSPQQQAQQAAAAAAAGLQQLLQAQQAQQGQQHAQLRHEMAVLLAQLLSQPEVGGIAKPLLPGLPGGAAPGMHQWQHVAALPVAGPHVAGQPAAAAPAPSLAPMLLDTMVQQLQQGPLLAAHGGLNGSLLQRHGSGTTQLPHASALLSSLLGGNGGVPPPCTTQASGARHTPGVEEAASSMGAHELPPQPQHVLQPPTAPAARAASGSAGQGSGSADEPAGPEQPPKRARLE